MNTMRNPDALTAREIADVVAARIRTNAYPAGSELPLASEMAAEFGVSRNTITVALRHLANEGLVFLPRSGTRTKVSPLHTRILRDGTSRYRTGQRERAGARGAFEAEAMGASLAPTWTTTLIPDALAPNAVCAAFGVPAGTRFFARAREMRTEGVVTQVAVSYIPKEIAAGTAMAEQDSGPGGIKSRMREHGHAQAAATEDLIFRPPSKEEQAALGVGAHQGVVELTHVARTADGRVVEVAVHLAPAHLWRFRYQVPIEQA